MSPRISNVSGWLLSWCKLVAPHWFQWNFINLCWLRIWPWNSCNIRSASLDQFIQSQPISFSTDILFLLKCCHLLEFKPQNPLICLSRHHKHLHPSRQDFKTCCEPPEFTKQARKGTLWSWGRIHGPARHCGCPAAGSSRLRCWDREGGSTDFIGSALVFSEEAKQANSIPH